MRIRQGWRFVALAAAAGCGKPAPPQQGGPGDFPVSAVVARAERRTVEDRVVLAATLISRDEVNLISELDATVIEIAFTEGGPVRKDDPLFRFDPTRTQARLEEAEAGFRLTELAFQRNRDLLANQTISQEEYDQTEATFYDRKAALALARDEQAKTLIQAPFDGVVGEREVSVGQFVTRGAVLARLAAMDPLEIVIDVPERHLGRLRSDLTVTYDADAFAGETVEGRVTYIAPQIDERTRTVRIKAEVPNPAGRLKPGLFGEAGLVLARRENAIVIPEACVQFLGEGTTVVAVNGAGRSEFRTVRIGKRFEGATEILEGLREGEHVVVEGFQKMGPGMTVHAAPESERYGVAPGPLGTAPAASAQDTTEETGPAGEGPHADL